MLRETGLTQRQESTDYVVKTRQLRLWKRKDSTENRCKDSTEICVKTRLEVLCQDSTGQCEDSIENVETRLQLDVKIR